MRIIVASSSPEPFHLTVTLQNLLSALKDVVILPVHGDHCQTPLEAEIYDDSIGRGEIEQVQCMPTLPHATGRDDTAAQLCDWADVLIVAPVDADAIARMLAGLADTLLLQILRGWNVSKKVLLVPGMSTQMWEHPLTKRHLSKIRRNWNWIRVLAPLLWTFPKSPVDLSVCTTANNFDPPDRDILPWKGMEDLMASALYLIELSTIGRDITLTKSPSKLPTLRKSTNVLPPELWTIIIDYVGDWELAQNLGIYTMLPVPPEWKRIDDTPESQLQWPDKIHRAVLNNDLDLISTLLTYKAPKAGPTPAPAWLPKQTVTLILRLGLVQTLRHLERHHRDAFWASFGHALVPDKASAVFGRVDVLEYWRTSPSFLTKEYTAAAMDGASKAGFVDVLEWWRTSGLPLKYTEAAMEQASSKGHAEVLEWWKKAAASSNPTAPPSSAIAGSGGGSSDSPHQHQHLRLKPGKSISYATQAGALPTLKWWASAGIPFQHEDMVAKLASTHGHVAALDLWRALRGEKLVFDDAVLVGPTKMGHVAVLEWWRRCGLRVEYKTCDIEEALEDGVEGERGLAVRRWWARNGLNLGVGTSEWMMTKVLGL